MNSPSRWSFLVAFLLTLVLPRLAFAEETCSEGWKKKAYLGVRDSIVTIETVGFSMEHIEPVAGVVWPTRSYVVAISHGAGIGRGVTVRFQNGKEIHAEPVAIDRARHVTILKLDEEGPAPPARITDRPLEVGKELVNVSPFEGVTPADEDETALDVKLHVGHVATTGDRTLLLFDATWPATIGAPLLDCSGDVVGLRGWGAILPAKDILAVVPNGEAVKDRQWDPVHMHLGMLMHFDSRAHIGVSTGWAMVAGDRWQFRVGFGALAGIPTPSEREKKEKDQESVATARLQLEHTVGYRLLLNGSTFSTYLVPQVGVVGRLDIQTKHETENVITDVGCVERGGPCKVDQNTTSTTSGSVALLPVFGASLVIPGAALSYQLQLDTKDPSRSTHQVFFGFDF